MNLKNCAQLTLGMTGTSIGANTEMPLAFESIESFERVDTIFNVQV